MADTADHVEGIDLPSVSLWLEENIPGSRGPFTFELIAGGRSNLTYRVQGDDGWEAVLRRPPTSHVLPTAHDMGREYRIIAALGPAGLPVAPALGYCPDPAVTGQPFYIMGFVHGHVLRDTAAAKQFSEEQRRRAGEALVDVLADIHAVDVDAVGLGDLGRKEGYIARQLKRWYSQYEQSAAQVGAPVPLIDEVHELLAGQIPEQGPAAIVHGDYRLDNAMLGDDGSVKAVLDWEICTLGDPLADVGLLMVYWAEPGDESAALLVAPTMLPGFSSRAEVRRRYADRSGRNLDQLDFYIAFGYWKLACIIEGVYARYAGGAMGGDRSNYEGFRDQVETLARAARNTIGAAG
jgi:aminoglycoside phosphotransferase (APT) family kinase protein